MKEQKLQTSMAASELLRGDESAFAVHSDRVERVVIGHTCDTPCKDEEPADNVQLRRTAGAGREMAHDLHENKSAG